MRKFIQKILASLSRSVIKKYQPKVIGVTGSAGKTSARDAIYAVLSVAYKVRCPHKNYNNEIGLPLVIIGSESPGKSIIGWIGVILKAIRLVILKDKSYPDFLVLEYGVDRPGDMKYLTDIVKPDIGVITLISVSHAEFFGTLDKIKKEKFGLIKGLDSDGFAIINVDDKDTASLTYDVKKGRVVGFGINKQADVKAEDLVFSFEKAKEAKNLQGMKFTLSYLNFKEDVYLPHVIGYQAIYAALAAAAVGLTVGMDLKKIAEALSAVKMPAGRMRLIDGNKKTLIIDDTYNSSPAAVFAALDFVARIPMADGAKKIAMLGDMLELGQYTEISHREVGERLTSSGIDILVSVGERARDFSRGAIAAGMNKDVIFEFPDSVEAGKFIENRMQGGDLILVKGSQGVRMEKIVMEIMAEPLRATELLVRQDKRWD